MRTANCILFFLLIFINSIAQENKALDILKSLEKQQKIYKNISLEFEFTIQAKNINEKQKGKLIVEGKKSILEFNQQLSICNGETKWIYLKNMKPNLMSFILFVIN